MEFTITAVNPLEHADIKRLFAMHGRPEFPAFFDRAYASAVRAGGKSWLAHDGAGNLVMHVACFPRRLESCFSTELCRVGFHCGGTGRRCSPRR